MMAARHSFNLFCRDDSPRTSADGPRAAPPTFGLRKRYTIYDRSTTSLSAEASLRLLLALPSPSLPPFSWLREEVRNRASLRARVLDPVLHREGGVREKTQLQQTTRTDNIADLRPRPSSAHTSDGSRPKPCTGPRPKPCPGPDWR